MSKARVAIFASGNGSNFQVLAEKFQSGEINGDLTLLFCDQAKAYSLERAKRLNVPAVCFSPKDFPSKKDYEAQLLEVLDEYKVDIIVLAGYMRIIGDELLSAYPNRIINIHPSLLPAFPGLHGIKDAYEAGVSQTGVTVHYIDAGVDTGPIIEQAKVLIDKDDDLASLEEKIHKTEHKLYPLVIKEVLDKFQEGSFNK